MKEYQYQEIDELKSSWIPVISDKPYRPVLGPIPTNIISDLDDGTECTLSRFVCGAELGGVIDRFVSGLCCHLEGSEQGREAG